MPTERIQIIVSSRGAVTVRKDIESVGRASQNSARGVGMLQGALATLVSAGTIRALATYADTFTGIQNRLKLVSDSTEALTTNTDNLLRIANDSRTSFEALAGLYERTISATRDLGISSERATNFIDLLAKTATASGSSAIETANALRQLSQGLASGQLRGEEFRSVAEQLPKILDVLTEATGKTRGEIRDLAYDGQLTPEILIGAFEKMGDSIRTEFANLTPTIGQALTVLQNNFIAFTGQVNQSIGIFDLFANAILLAANNLPLLLAALTPVVAALTIMATQVIGSLVIGSLTSMITTFGRLGLFLTGTIIPTLVSLTSSLVGFGAALVTTVIPAIARFTAVLLTNPIFGALAVATITSLVLMKDRLIELGNSIQETVLKLSNLEQFGDFLGGAFNINVRGEEFAARAAAAFSSGGQVAGNQMKAAIEAGGANAANNMGSAIDRAADTYARLNGKAVKELGNVLTSGGEFMYNQVTGAVTKAGEDMGTNIAKSGEYAGLTMGDNIVGASKQAGANMQGGIAAGSNSMVGDLINLFNSNIGPFLRGIVFDMIKGLVSAQRDLLRAQTDLAKAQANQANAQARAIEEGRNNSGYGGGGYGGGRSSSSGTFIVPGFDQNYNRGNVLPEPTKTVTTEETPINTAGTVPQRGGVTINNIIDPKLALNAVDTDEGNETIVNVIRGNRDEIQQILGVSG